MADLERAADKLGLHHYVFAADTEGLKALPSVLVGYVEHDHFVAITKTDSTGVTYLCADCGRWPGGTQHVTWKQWRMMEAGPYMALATPGSDTDEALKLASAEARPGAASNLVTSRNAEKILNREKAQNELRTKQPGAPFSALTGRYPAAPSASDGEAEGRGRQDKGYHGLHLAAATGQSVSVAAIMRLAARLKGHVVLTDPPTASVKCGGKLQGDECGCHIKCPVDRHNASCPVSVHPPRRIVPARCRRRASAR